jgi:hypothetical protein
MMKLNRSNIVSGCVGTVMGACSVLGIQAVSGSKGHSFSLLHRPNQTMYERVEADEDGDVYITSNGKKYHRYSCYILERASESKQVSSDAAKEAGFKPCKKCNP